MKVRCIKTSIDAQGRGISNANLEGFIKINSIFYVYGMRFTVACTYLYIFDGEHLIEVPLELFEIVENTFHNNIKFKMWEGNESTLWPGLFYEEGFLENFAEREKRERLLFEELRNEIEKNRLNIGAIKLIERYVEQFIKNQIDMVEFVNALSGFLNSLEYVDIELENKIRAAISTIQMNYDTAVDKSSLRWHDASNVVIQESIRSLKKITHDIIGDYLKKVDSSVAEVAILLEEEWYMCPTCNEVWKSELRDAMVLCPKCDHVLHNPRYATIQ